MQLRLGLAMLIAFVPIGCTGDEGADTAMQTVEEFQAALRAGDARECRRLVTEESALALADFPWDLVRDKKALQVLGAERADSFYRVQVKDPNEGGETSDIIVVREYGRVVIDLVATAGLTAEFTEGPTPGGEFAPRELTPADHDRIRQQQLATPPR